MQTRSPLFDSQALQDIGEFGNLVLEFGIGDMTLFIRIVAHPQKGGFVTHPSLDVTVDAVVGDIDLATFEPLDRNGVRIKRIDFVPFFKPGESSRILSPKAIGVIERAPMHIHVLLHG